MFAVIKTGGKQYCVEPGKKIKIEKIEAAKNGKIVFDEVLLLADDKKVDVGMPHVKGAHIEGVLIKQGRTQKIIVFRYHNKTRTRVKRGHRQYFAEVEITKVS